MNTNQIKNKYLQQAQNKQAGANPYINNQKQDAQTIAQNVLAQKYGSNAQFDPNKGFYDYGNAKANYNPNQDLELSARYNKAMKDYNNLSQANQQLQNYNQQLQDQNRQASLQYQQSQKYNPSQLQAVGLGNTGYAESSQAGLLNTYSNILASNRQNYAQNVNDMYKSLADATQESNINLAEQINQIKQLDKENQESNMLQLMQSATSQQQLDEIYNEFGTDNENITNAYKILSNQLASLDQQNFANALTSAQSVDQLDRYYELYKNSMNPTSQQLYEDIRGQLLQNKQAEDINKLQQYGIEDYNDYKEIATISPSDFNYHNAEKEGKYQNSLIKYLQQYGSYIPDGKVVDLNTGAGTDKYLVYDGKLYKTDQDVSEGFQGKDLYNKLKKYRENASKSQK